MIGILALQGNYHAHNQTLDRLNIPAKEVRYPNQLTDIDGLIIPGGESSTINDLMSRIDFHGAIKTFAEKKPVLGTCAGLILMSRVINNDNKIKPLGLLDLEVSRNAYGRQADSFIGEISFLVQNHSFTAKAPFIRAPKILKISESVEAIGNCRGNIVAVKSGNHIGLTFHPELSDIIFFHDYMFKKKSTIKKEINAA